MAEPLRFKKYFIGSEDEQTICERLGLTKGKLTKDRLLERLPLKGPEGWCRPQKKQLLEEIVKAFLQYKGELLDPDTVTDQRKYEKKLAKVPKAGALVKGRSASTKHGYVCSMSKEHGPKITEDEEKERNERLGIDPTVCFWCKKNKKECNDHLHPCVNTKESQYSFINALNIVPACNECNNKKGGTPLKEWVALLDECNGWDTERKEELLTWSAENKHKLLMPEDHCKFIEAKFVEIDENHTKYDNDIKNFKPQDHNAEKVVEPEPEPETEVANSEDEAESDDSDTDDSDGYMDFNTIKLDFDI